MGEKTTPTGHTRALISLKEIEEVNCPLCGALVNVDVRQGPARNRRVQDFPETLKRATILSGSRAVSRIERRFPLSKKKPEKSKPKPKRGLDERTAIPLDPEEAIRALLQVDPESEPADGKPEKKKEEGPAE